MGGLIAAMRSLFLVAVLAAANAAAQFPAKPVHLLTGAPPGTPGDVMSRIIAEPLAAHLGQPVIVENRPGAITTLALAVVAKSAPDGHMLSTLTLPGTVAPHLLSSSAVDVARDLAPVSQVAWVSNVLVVRPAAPFSSVAELVALARQQPHLLTFASGGNGTPAHLSGELLRASAAIDMRHVPFNGAVAGVTAVMGEQVDMMFAIAPSVIPHIRAAKLRALATPAPARLPALPDVPTLAELGYAVDVRDWVGVVAPAATPHSVISRLESALGAVLAQPVVKERLAAAGFEPAESGSDAFGKLVRSELQRWGRVVREAGIKSD